MDLGTPTPIAGLSEKRFEPRRNYAFLLPTMVAATMLIAVGATGSKAEAAMIPGVGTLPAQTKNYTPVEKVYYRRYYRRGYYGYPRPVMDIGLLRLRLRLSAIRLLWLWLETGHQHWHRAWLGLALLKAAPLLRRDSSQEAPALVRGFSMLAESHLKQGHFHWCAAI